MEIQALKVTYKSSKLTFDNVRIANPHDKDSPLSWVLEFEDEEELINEINSLFEDSAYEWEQSYSYLHTELDDEVEDEAPSIVVEFISHEEFKLLRESGIDILTV